GAGLATLIPYELAKQRACETARDTPFEREERIELQYLYQERTIRVEAEARARVRLVDVVHRLAQDVRGIPPETETAQPFTEVFGARVNDTQGIQNARYDPDPMVAKEMGNRVRNKLLARVAERVRVDVGGLVNARYQDLTTLPSSTDRSELILAYA